MNRRILITGASNGLGRSLALELASPGNELIVTGRQPDALESVVEGIRAKGAIAHAYQLELSSSDAVRAFGDAIADTITTLDLLVNNAAVIKLGLLANSTPEDMEWHYRVNVLAPMILTQCLLGPIRKAHGQVVFVNSAAGLQAPKGAALYAASKHAMKAIADSLREEVSPDGITVLTAFPSRMNTPMQKRVLEMEGGGPLKPFLQPEEVAKVIATAMERCRHGEVKNVACRLGEPPRFW